MDIQSLSLVYFSPTETTQKIVDGISKGIRVDIAKRFDLTPPDAKRQKLEEINNELTIIGVPVYGGRIPIEAVRRLRKIKVNDTPAVVVVVYGNREYEDALLELRDLVTELGFKPIAGGAFIGEHSYNSNDTPIATGRPDTQDLEKAKAFGNLIQEKITPVSTLDEITPIQVPGNFPYKEWNPPSGISPKTVDSLCNHCETCFSVCPTAAITVSETVMTDDNACILCSACVKKCPAGARVWEAEWITKVGKWLSENCHERKEIEMYL